MTQKAMDEMVYELTFLSDTVYGYGSMILEDRRELAALSLHTVSERLDALVSMLSNEDIPLELPADLGDAIEKMAKSAGRSYKEQIIILLTEYVAERKSA